MAGRKKSKKTRQTTRDIGNKFHKRVHSLFLKMGFEVTVSDVNAEGPDLIVTDPESTKGNGLKLIIQCKRSESGGTYPTIQSLIDEYSEKRRRYKAAMSLLFLSGFKIKKNFDYQKTLENSNVAVLDDALIDYYRKLTDKIGAYTKYQFLTDIGLDIEFDEPKKYRAIQVIQNGARFYVFKISPEHLLKLTCVTRRVPRAGSVKGYQRLLSARVKKEIPTFLETPDWVLPNNIICVAEEGKVLAYEDGSLVLPSKHGFLWVIDGQHRLFSFANTSELIRKKSEIVCAVLDPSSLGADKTVREAQIFIDLNSHAKKVDKALLLELNEYLGKDDPELIAVMHLAETTAFKGLISGYSNKEGSIKLATFVTNSAMKSLRKLLPQENPREAGEYLGKQLEPYFRTVAKVFGKMWGSKIYIVSENRGIRALLKIYVKIAEKDLREGKKVDLKDIGKRFKRLKLAWPSFAVKDYTGKYLGEGGSDQLANEWLAQMGYASEIAREPIGSESIESIIKRGESATAEFKSSIWWDYKQSQFITEREKDVLKSVAGFLNSYEGGTLLIGVDDSGHVLGLENDWQKFPQKLSPNQKADNFIRQLQSLFKDKLQRNGRLILATRIKVSCHKVDEKDVCMIRVTPHDQAVYVAPLGEFFLRSGNETQRLTGPEIEEFISQRFAK